ncbi:MULTISPECIES: hypothetical protein [Erythrobacter]|uniref:hypothetical protein n=1 Tax=Erythrobacter TaxID=1041 RepID=UPI001F2EC327|nr:hypothetical protein [Erythrobacter sp. SN021]MCF8883383.1 hypothetical protein [Erythrobacter sp. SN021]
MKKSIMGVVAAALAAASAPAAAYPNHDFHIRYTYLDNSGAVIGTFTVYCNGWEVSEGVTSSSNYRVTYGNCDAP